MDLGVQKGIVIMAYMSIREMIALHHPEYLKVEEYPMDKVAAIVKTTDEWGIFGNFYKYPTKAGKREPMVTVEGVPFDCTERLFQEMKIADPECLRLIDTKPCGICFKRQMAKILKEHGQEWRTDWQDIIMDAMKFCLQKKYEQSKAFRDELERSKGLYIVEDETKHLHGKEPLWGASQVSGMFRGSNVLGKLLMELRDNGKLEYQLPDDILDLIKGLPR